MDFPLQLWPQCCRLTDLSKPQVHVSMSLVFCYSASANIRRNCCGKLFHTLIYVLFGCLEQFGVWHEHLVAQVNWGQLRWLIALFEVKTQDKKVGVTDQMFQKGTGHQEPGGESGESEGPQRQRMGTLRKAQIAWRPWYRWKAPRLMLTCNGSKCVSGNGKGNIDTRPHIKSHCLYSAWLLF